MSSPPGGILLNVKSLSGMVSVGVACRIASFMDSARLSAVPGFAGSSFRLPVTP